MSAVMAEPAADAAPARRPKKKVLLIGVVVLVLTLALAAGAIVFIKQRAARAAAAAGDDEGGAAAETATATANHIDPKSVPIYLPLDPFIVNLADKDVDRYAQIGITLELESTVFADQVKAYMPAVRNAILLILAQKSSRDLLGRSGKEELAEEIMRESVRPMGLEILAPEPVSGATAVAAAGSGAEKTAQDEATPIKASKKAKKAAVRNPVQHVHFSSFIIQ